MTSLPATHWLIVGFALGLFVEKMKNLLASELGKLLGSMDGRIWMKTMFDLFVFEISCSSMLYNVFLLLMQSSPVFTYPLAHAPQRPGYPQ